MNATRVRILILAVCPRLRTHYSHQMTVAARQMAEKKVWAQRSQARGDAAPVLQLGKHVLDYKGSCVARNPMARRTSVARS
jgi:hypothetical protein